MGEQTIRCTVNTCYYYGTGDRCRASMIMVANNPAAITGDPEAEFSAELGTFEAATSVHTQCHTFIPKQQGPKQGIKRLD